MSGQKCHGDMEDALSMYIDGELSPDERKSLESHLAECEECRAALEELRLLKGALGSLLEVPVPEELHDRIMNAVREEAEELRAAGLISRESAAGRTAYNGLPEKVGPVSGFLKRLARMPFRRWAPILAGAMVLVLFISVGGRYLSGSFGLLGPKSAADYARGTEGYPSSDMQAAPEAPSMPPDEGMAKYAAASNESRELLGDSASEVQRKIIKRGQVSVEVGKGKVPETAERATAVIATNFGYVEQSSVTGGVAKELTSYYMVARVPAEQMDAVIVELRALGRVTGEGTSADDITDRYVDLDARLRNKIKQEDRLLEIVGQAKNVDELLQVESELSRVRGDIESMQAQKNTYDRLTTLATLSFSALEEGSTATSPSPWKYVWDVFVRAWRDLLITTAGALPTLIVFGGVAAIAWWLWRRKAKKTKSA